MCQMSFDDFSAESKAKPTTKKQVTAKKSSKVIGLIHDADTGVYCRNCQYWNNNYQPENKLPFATHMFCEFNEYGVGQFAHCDSFVRKGTVKEDDDD